MVAQKNFKKLKWPILRSLAAKKNQKKMPNQRLLCPQMSRTQVYKTIRTSYVSRLDVLVPGFLTEVNMTKRIWMGSFVPTFLFTTGTTKSLLFPVLAELYESKAIKKRTEHQKTLKSVFQQTPDLLWTMWTIRIVRGKMGQTKQCPCFIYYLLEGSMIHS